MLKFYHLHAMLPFRMIEASNLILFCAPTLNEACDRLRSLAADKKRRKQEEEAKEVGWFGAPLRLSGL